MPGQSSPFPWFHNNMTEHTPFHLRFLNAHFLSKLDDFDFPALEQTLQTQYQQAEPTQLLTTLENLLCSNAALQSHAEDEALLDFLDWADALLEKLQASASHTERAAQLQGWITLQRGWAMLLTDEAYALECLHQQQQRFAEQCAQDAADAESRVGLCFCLQAMAAHHLLPKGDVAQAQTLLQQGQEVLQQLRALCGTPLPLLQLQVRQLLLQNLLAEKREDMAAAKEALQAALDFSAQALAAAPQHPNTMHQHGEVLYVLGRAAFLRQELTPATDYLQQALALAQQLEQAFPSDEARAMIGTRARLLGKTLVFADQLQAGLQHLQDSAQQFRQLALAQNTNPLWLSEAGESEEMLARALHSASRYQQAQQHCNAGHLLYKQAILRNPGDVAAQIAQLRLQLLEVDCLRYQNQLDAARQLNNKVGAALRRLAQHRSAQIRHQAGFLQMEQEAMRVELSAKPMRH